MPFYDTLYYPFLPESQGTRSSAGIPSLLTSPQSQLSSGRESSPPGVSAGVMPPFKFRARHESVDWRRINAVDVDRVACELDFQTLQEYIVPVTFCNVEGERCVRCQNQVDPALLKLFRLAQLTVEYLLHSQDCLTLSLQAAEERLQAAVQETEQLKAQLQKQSQDAKSLKDELKEKKKIITSREAMISAAMASFHKCQHCEKIFMNTSYLQKHMQRRHPTECEIYSIGENQKKAQNEKLQEEINRLQEQLTLAKTQMESQQKENLAKQEKDLTQRQEEFMRQLESWKEDERARMSSKIDDVKQACQREMDSLHQKNQNLEKEVLKLQHSCRVQESSHSSSRQSFEDKYSQAPFFQHEIHKQETKWAAELQKAKEEHDSEKRQLKAALSRMRTSVSESEEAQRQVELLELRVQEQQQIITSQRKQIQKISANPPAVPVQQEEQTCLVHKLDPIVELSEEDEGSSSDSEVASTIGSWQQKSKELQKNPDLKREMRPAIEELLQSRLHDLGVENKASGLSRWEYESAMAQLMLDRQKEEKQQPQLGKVRKLINHKLEQSVKQRAAVPPCKPKQKGQAKREAQSRPWSSSLPATVTRVSSSPAVKDQTTSQLGKRSKTNSLPKTSTPRLLLTNPPLSSDEDSSEEEASMIKPFQVQESSPSRCKAPQVNSNTAKALQHGSVDNQPSAARYAGDLKTPDMNGNVQKTSHGYGKLLERQSAARGQGTSAGGTLPGPSGDNVVRELKYSPVYDDERNAGHVSSLDTSTSVWGTFTGKAHTPGLSDTGTGSTLKSSIVTVSDWDDTDDI